MTKMYEEIMEQPQVLAGILKTNEQTLEALLAEIRKADIKQVVIAARGTSDHCAIYAKYLIEMLLKLPVSLAAPSVNTLYGSEITYQDALVIGISQSGMAADVLSVVADANKSGMITVAVTNNSQSPMAKEAKFNLDCAAGLEKSVAATKTFTAQMYCLASLIARWSENKELTEALDVLPQGIGKEVAKAQDVMELAKEYTFMQSCIVLGRGLQYPIALEASLKMMETTYTNARGFAISDFQHGPLALISDNLPVFVYCSSDEAMDDVLASTKQYAELGAYVLMVTDDKENAKDADKCLLIEKSSKYTAPFHMVVTAQMFACGLADAKRCSPDAPRHIKKVTITK
ncbi:MAG: SIS domain-containing protein [Christensenella sp.]|uniref:SIS domain-containing protein n=1 Tax=Christensenella sp. TaxID=1935934 RepID=UPI002B21B952|nr:SIS domain-containing protein [Christensenella sp.]MEA5002981.1 SIS domain-containing protein [Christensenella sp.]